jgi:hypothetical protein
LATARSARKPPPGVNVQVAPTATHAGATTPMNTAMTVALDKDCLVSLFLVLIDPKNSSSGTRHFHALSSNAPNAPILTEFWSPRKVGLTTRKPLPPVELGALRSPHGLTVAEGQVHFTPEGSKVIGHYDPFARQIGVRW